MLLSPTLNLVVGTKNIHDGRMLDGHESPIAFQVVGLRWKTIEPSSKDT
tara:strand:+ start:23692 stop:23838 length:147 start_codon:yes stop_codon:yes gene_type:complete